MAPDDIICPYCSVETSREELRQNRLCCTTCGFDFSEADDPDDQDVDEDWDGEDDADAAADEDEDEDADGDEDGAWSV
jgi:rubredoxin